MWSDAGCSKVDPSGRRYAFGVTDIPSVSPSIFFSVYPLDHLLLSFFVWTIFCRTCSLNYRLLPPFGASGKNFLQGCYYEVPWGRKSKQSQGTQLEQTNDSQEILTIKREMTEAIAELQRRQMIEPLFVTTATAYVCIRSY